MAKGMHPNSRANLVMFRPGQSGNPAGPRPSFRTFFKKLPKDAQAKAAEALWAALAMPNYEEAAKFLKEKEAELPECGFMFQVALRGLMGKDGAWVLGSLLDRLFGKPRQQAEVKHTGNAAGVQVVVQSGDAADAVNTLLSAAKASKGGPDKEAF